MEQTPILREGHEAPWKNDTNSGSLSMYWVFTAWQEPTLDHADPPGWLNYLTFGKEVCPTTDKTHWQGYIEFKTKKRIPWIRKQFKELMGVNDIYLALRRGTPQQAIAYAHKDGIITEIGVRPEKGGQGNRTDLQLIADAVKTGELRSLKDGIDNGAIATFQQLKIAEKVIPIYAPKRNWVPEVIVHWGPSSTGKTRLAHHETNGDDLYITGGEFPKWWPEYSGQGNVVIDEFRGSMIKLSDLLRLLDRYPYTVPLKCGHAQFLAKRIYITSPFHPKDWYPNCGEQMKQLFRRISKIRYFYREIDDTDDVTAIQYTSTSGSAAPLMAPLIEKSPVGDSDPTIRTQNEPVPVPCSEVHRVILAVPADNLWTPPPTIEDLDDLINSFGAT